MTDQTKGREAEIREREWAIPEAEWLRDLDQWLAHSCNEDDDETAVCHYSDLRRLRELTVTARDEQNVAHDERDAAVAENSGLLADLAEARAEVERLNEACSFLRQRDEERGNVRKERDQAQADAVVLWEHWTGAIPELAKRVAAYRAALPQKSTTPAEEMVQKSKA